MATTAAFDVSHLIPPWRMVILYDIQMIYMIWKMIWTLFKDMRTVGVHFN